MREDVRWQNMNDEEREEEEEDDVKPNAGGCE
jgi:hypothetical protein